MPTRPTSWSIWQQSWPTWSAASIARCSPSAAVARAARWRWGRYRSRVHDIRTGARGCDRRGRGAAQRRRGRGARRRAVCARVHGPRRRGAARLVGAGPRRRGGGNHAVPARTHRAPGRSARGDRHLLGRHQGSRRQDQAAGAQRQDRGRARRHPWRPPSASWPTRSASSPPTARPRRAASPPWWPPPTPTSTICARPSTPVASRATAWPRRWLRASTLRRIGELAEQAHRAGRALRRRGRAVSCRRSAEDLRAHAGQRRRCGRGRRARHDHEHARRSTSPPPPRTSTSFSARSGRTRSSTAPATSPIALARGIGDVLGGAVESGRVSRQAILDPRYEEITGTRIASLRRLFDVSRVPLERLRPAQVRDRLRRPRRRGAHPRSSTASWPSTRG